MHRERRVTAQRAERRSTWMLAHRHDVHHGATTAQVSKKVPLMSCCTFCRTFLCIATGCLGRGSRCSSLLPLCPPYRLVAEDRQRGCSSGWQQGAPLQKAHGPTKRSPRPSDLAAGRGSKLSQAGDGGWHTCTCHTTASCWLAIRDFPEKRRSEIGEMACEEW